MSGFGWDSVGVSLLTRNRFSRMFIKITVGLFPRSCETRGQSVRFGLTPESSKAVIDSASGADGRPFSDCRKLEENVNQMMMAVLC